MKKLALFMAELALYKTGSAVDRSTRNKDKPMKTSWNRFLGFRLLLNACAIVCACLAVVLILVPVPCALGQTFYELTVHNNFGPDEFYNATPTDAQIWLLSNFKFDYMSSGNWTVGNATAGSYASVRLSDISQGKIRIYRTNGGTRMYAILSDAQPTPALARPLLCTALQLLRVEF